MLGLVEREAYLIMHVLHLNVDVSFKVLCIWNRTRGGSRRGDLRPTSGLGLSCEWTFVLNIISEMLYHLIDFSVIGYFPKLRISVDYTRGTIPRIVCI